MLKLIRFLALVSQSVFLQFAHLVGFGAFLIAVAFGYFRLPSWSVPILAVALGVVADKYLDVSDVTGLLEKAEKASERGGFLIVVYAVITIVGYLVGAYGRHYLDKARGTTPAPSNSSKK